jgi:uncharacterized protein
MEILILCAVLLVSLFMIPLGLPGLWVMLAAGVGYSLLVPNSIGVVTLLGITAIAVIAEVLEWTLAGSYARKYGGSKRAGWGAVIGGMVGAMFIGFGIPIIGHVLGAFFGAFAGALVFEYSREYNHRVATRVAWGALIGRVVAAALKVVAGLLMAIWLVIAAL